jgi:hypothetical protein
MSFYLVKAEVKKDKLGELREKLMNEEFRNLHPFGRALNFGLKNAKEYDDGIVAWEEEDHCNPPLAQEKEAVLNNYFDNIKIELVIKGEGWKKINHLPNVFNSLHS